MMRRGFAPISDPGAKVARKNRLGNLPLNEFIAKAERHCRGMLRETTEGRFFAEALRRLSIVAGGRDDYAGKGLRESVIDLLYNLEKEELSILDSELGQRIASLTGAPGICERIEMRKRKLDEEIEKHRDDPNWIPF